MTVVDDFLGMVGLGVAGFVDHGGAWYAGSPRRTGWDAGIGIRLGASRSTDTDALRLRSGAAVRQRCPGCRLGGDRREGFRLLAAGQTDAIIRHFHPEPYDRPDPARPRRRLWPILLAVLVIPFVLFSLYVGLMLAWEAIQMVETGRASSRSSPARDGSVRRTRVSWR